MSFWQRVKSLAGIGKKSLGRNDKRLLNALQQGLELLDKELKAALPENRPGMVENYEKYFHSNLVELYEAAVLAAFSTVQHDRGLEIISLYEHWQWLEAGQLILDKARFFAALGRMKEAEELLLPFVEQEPEDVWNYINLGDLFFHDQVLAERRDLRRAQEWYYRAYDKGLADAESEDVADLLERLGEATVERLRLRALRDLLEMLEELHIGRWQTMEDFRRSVYLAGSDSPILQFLQAEVIRRSGNIKRADKLTHILTCAYNLLPQGSLNGLCPFEMREYFRAAPLNSRIQKEMFGALEEALRQGKLKPPVDAEGSEAFQVFQGEFLAQKDPLTGQIRSKLIDGEIKATQKLIDDGEFIWMGFLKYRYVNSLAEFEEAVGKN